MSIIRSFILHLIASVAGLWLVDYLLADFCATASTAMGCETGAPAAWTALIVGGLVLGLANGILKPILKLISLPFVFLTLGLFVFVINAALFGLTVWLVNTLNIGGEQLLIAGSAWLVALQAGLILGIFNFFMHWLLRR